MNIAITPSNPPADGCKGCGNCACGKAQVKNMAKHMQVTMPDGSQWAVPVRVIAEHHARYYSKDYQDDVDACMKLHTAPLFDNDQDAIEDWAENNMDWKDVMQWAVQVMPSEEVDYQDGWCNGKKSFINPPKAA